MKKEYVLKTDKLTKVYGKNKVVNEVSMHVKKGDIYGFIGKNGAGKTTFMRMVSGLASPTEGSMELFGEKDLEVQRKRIGSLIESPGIYPNMTASDNLEVVRRILGITDRHIVEKILEFVGLESAGKKKVKNFSMGMKQRLGLAISLMRNPDFLVLDEPINGLDPQGIIEMRELILKLNKEKRITILISSHYLDELSKIATHYGFLDHGTIIKEITSFYLMKKMKHKIKLKVKNQKEFVKYFEENQISYEVIDSKTIHVYGKYNLSQLIMDLSKKNLVAEEVHEQEESLENYYMNLIGGSKND